MLNLLCIIGLSLILLASATSVSATTFYVSTTGNDSNPGTVRTNVLRTIQSPMKPLP